MLMPKVPRCCGQLPPPAWPGLVDRVHQTLFKPLAPPFSYFYSYSHFWIAIKALQLYLATSFPYYTWFVAEQR